MRFIGRIGNRLLFSDRLAEPIPQEEFSPPKHDTQGDSNVFQYGPITGGLMENLEIEIYTSGEVVNAARVIPYKQRDVNVCTHPEKALLGIERINGNFGASHTIAFLSALEAACSLERTEELSLGRALQLELERIRNHIFVCYRLCDTAGFSVPSAHLLYLVEETNRIIGKAFGHRYFYGANTLQGFRMKEYPDLGKLERIVSEFEDTARNVLENRIFIDRLQGCGVVNEEHTIGPAARACGLEFDARLDGDYKDTYAKLGFKPKIQESRDAFGRLLVRVEEVSESFRILERIKIEKLSDEILPISCNGITGSGAGRVESPSGDLAYYVSLKSGRISEASLLAPSEISIKLFSLSMPGGVFTDLPFNWESFGIWVSEVSVSLK